MNLVGVTLQGVMIIDFFEGSGMQVSGVFVAAVIFVGAGAILSDWGLWNGGYVTDSVYLHWSFNLAQT